MATPPLEQRLTGLTPDDLARARALVTEIEVCDREIASLEARKATATAQLARLADADAERSANPDGRDYARRALSAEIAAVTRTHPQTARSAMDEAERLTDDFPATLAALSEGRISKRHADAVLDVAGTVSPEHRGEFDKAAAALAETRTPGDVRRLARVKAEQLEEKSLRERHREARRERRVTIADRENGMSELYAYLPTLEARAIKDRLTETARIVKRDRARARAEQEKRARRRRTEGASEPVPVVSASVLSDAVDPGAADLGRGVGTAFGVDVPAPAEIAATDRRTLDQLRADAFTMMLLTAKPTGHALFSAGTGADLEDIHATVQVTIPASMIMDPDEGAAWLDEGVLVSPDSARHLAGLAPGWERLFVRPDTGEIIASDHYRPTAAQRRRLIGRDVSCRFPGCTVPARKADIDHTRDYARGGLTVIDNLACLCEAHHVMKHQSGWAVRQIAEGVLEWTSPTGRVYRDEPPSRVFFAEAPPRGAEAADTSVAPDSTRGEAVSRARPRRLTTDELTAGRTWEFPEAPGDEPAPWERTGAAVVPTRSGERSPARSAEHTSDQDDEHASVQGDAHPPTSTPAHPPSSDVHAPAHAVAHAPTPVGSLLETHLAALLPLAQKTHRVLVDLHPPQTC